jgi:ubiquinone/menaquinone biosynthesis C-methylase UbiE
MDKKEKILSKVGDLIFRRCIEADLSWLDIQPGDEILDLGCGEGFITMVMTELHREISITSVDWNTDLLKSAEGWISRKGHITFVNCDMETGLPFEDNTFDKAVFNQVLEHLNKDEYVLSELHRVMKPGGVVALTVPNRNYPFLFDPLNWTKEHFGLGHFNSKNTILGGMWSYDHKRLYSIEELEAICEKVHFVVADKGNFSHYCLPCNYLMLRLGKIIYTALPFRSLEENMEKFSWNEIQPGSKDLISKLLESAFCVCKRIDKRNDKVENDFNKSSVAIGVKLCKNR